MARASNSLPVPVSPVIQDREATWSGLPRDGEDAGGVVGHVHAIILAVWCIEWPERRALLLVFSERFEGQGGLDQFAQGDDRAARLEVLAGLDQQVELATAAFAKG